MPVRFLPTLFLFTLLPALMCAAAQDAGAQTAQPATLGAGVPRELARFRAEHYRDVRYALDIMLAPGADLLKGHEKVTVTLDAAAGDLVLDWRGIKNDVEPRTRGSAGHAHGHRSRAGAV